MIPGHRIRKAIALKVPFLQCVENFHTLSLTQLRTALPPENTEDFDIQMHKTIGDLRSLKSNLTSDVAILYSKFDLPKPGLEFTEIGLPKLTKDLENEGFIVCVFYHMTKYF